MTTFTATASQRTTITARGTSMSDLRIVRDYPHPPSKVWRVLTEPAADGAPGDAARRLRARRRHALQARRRSRTPAGAGSSNARCSKRASRRCFATRGTTTGREGRREVAYTLEPHAGGTRLTVEHTGFTGVSGLLFTKLVMGPGWRKTLGTLSAVLATRRRGKLRPGSRSSRNTDEARDARSGPALRAADGLLPAGAERRRAVARHRGLEAAGDSPVRADLFGVLPGADGEAGEIRGAEGGRLEDLGPHDGRRRGDRPGTA